MKMLPIEFWVVLQIMMDLVLILLLIFFFKHLQTRMSAGASRKAVEQVVGVLERVEGVLNAEATEDGIYQVTCVQGRENRAELARAVTDQGWDLLELGTMRMSLEEIFLKLTEGETIDSITEEHHREESEEGKDA